MGIYDIAMLIVFIGAIFFGYWKGLTWQIASVAAIVVSYFVSVNFRDQIAGFIQTEEPWNRIGAMLILFLGTSLVIWTIYASVAKSLKKNELKGFDRQAGALLGAGKGVLLCMVITMFSVSMLGENAHEAIDHSRLGPYVEKAIWQVSDFVPAELAKYVDPHIQSYKEASQHGEPDVNPKQDIQNLFDGAGYTEQQGMSQNLNQIPNQGGFLGNYGAQPNQQTNWSTNWNSGTDQGSTQTSQNAFSDLNVSELSKKYLEQARQAGYQMTLETAQNEVRRQLDENSISEMAKKYLEQARLAGYQMTLEAAQAEVRRQLEEFQKR